MEQFMFGSGMMKSSMPSMARLGKKLWEFETGDQCRVAPPPSALMARYTSGHGTVKIYALNGQNGAKWNLKREVQCILLPRNWL